MKKLLLIMTIVLFMLAGTAFGTVETWWSQNQTADASLSFSTSGADANFRILIKSSNITTSGSTCEALLNNSPGGSGDMYIEGASWCEKNASHWSCVPSSLKQITMNASTSWNITDGGYNWTDSFDCGITKGTDYFLTLYFQNDSGVPIAQGGPTNQSNRWTTAGDKSQVEDWGAQSDVKNYILALTKIRTTPGAGSLNISFIPNSTNGTDAHTYEANPTQNYGSATYMEMGNAGGQELIAYMNWSHVCDSIPSGVDITYANLRVYVYDDHGWDAADVVAIYPLGAKWYESNITWNNKPSLNTSGNLITGDDSPGTGPAWWDLNINSDFICNDDYTVPNNFALRCPSCSTDDYVSMYSSDHADSGSRPVLQLTYTQLDAAPVFSGSNYNNTLPATNEVIQFNITVTDETELASFIFSYNNGTGTYANDSSRSLSGTSATLSVNKTMEIEYPLTYNWTWYAYDNQGNVTQSDVYSVLIIPSVAIDNCTLGGNQTAIFYLRNETTTTLINSTAATNTSVNYGMDITISYWIDYKGDRTYGNYSKSAQHLNNKTFCITPGSSWAISNITADFSYGTTHYTYEAYQLNLTNSSRSISLYIVDGTTEVTFTVKDTFDNSIEDAYITIEKYDVGTGTFKTTEILRTDGSGNAVGRLVLSTTNYKFTVSYKGVSYLVDGPTKVVSTTKSFRIDLLGSDYFDMYSTFLGIRYNMSYNNNTKNFKFDWFDPQTTLTHGCMRVISKNITGDILIADTCTATTAGTILVNIAGNGTTDQTYLATAIVTIGGYNFTVANLEYSFETEWSQWFEDDDETRGIGIFVTIMIVIAAAFLGAWNPVISIIMVILGVGAMILLNLFHLSWPIYVTLILMGILLIMRMGRR